MITSSEVADELSRLRTGGNVAVAELFEQYRVKLERMVRLRLDARLLGKVDVDDVLQDAYVEASRRIDDFLDRPAVPWEPCGRAAATRVKETIPKGCQVRQPYQPLDISPPARLNMLLPLDTETRAR